MANQPHAAWQVLEHGPIETLAENLWRVQGTVKGMSLRRTMTVARGDAGALVIHSGVAMEDGAMRELEALGEPRFLIVPNAYHRLDAAWYKSRYPKIQVFTPRGSRTKVENLVAVDGTLEEFPPNTNLRFEYIRGVGDVEGAMIVRSPDGVTVVLTDLVFNMDRKRDPLGWFFTTLLGSAPGPRVSRLCKLVMVKDQRAMREDLERLSELPDLVRLVVAHEKVASGDEAARALRTAASFLR